MTQQRATRRGTILHDVEALDASSALRRSTAVLTLLVLDLALDIVNSVRALPFQGDGLASEGLHKDLHACDCLQPGCSL